MVLAVTNCVGNLWETCRDSEGGFDYHKECRRHVEVRRVGFDCCKACRKPWRVGFGCARCVGSLWRFRESVLAVTKRVGCGGSESRF